MPRPCGGFLDEIWLKKPRFCGIAQTENKQSNTISSKRHASEARLIHKQQMLSVHYL